MFYVYMQTVVQKLSFTALNDNHDDPRKRICKWKKKL